LRIGFDVYINLEILTPQDSRLKLGFGLGVDSAVDPMGGSPIESQPPFLCNGSGFSLSYRNAIQLRLYEAFPSLTSEKVLVPILVVVLLYILAKAPG